MYISEMRALIVLVLIADAPTPILLLSRRLLRASPVKALRPSPRSFRSISLISTLFPRFPRYFTRGGWRYERFFYPVPLAGRQSGVRISSAIQRVVSKDPKV